MNVTNDTSPARTAPASRIRLERIESLLARYPGLTDPEIHEVLMFLKKGPALDIGLLSGLDAVKPQLERFRAEHARDLSIGLRELAIVGIVMLFLFAVVALLWDSGVRH